mgnify:FL=1
MRPPPNWKQIALSTLMFLLGVSMIPVTFNELHRRNINREYGLVLLIVSVYFIIESSYYLIHILLKKRKNGSN